MTDRELLRAFQKERTAANFQPLLDRYLPFVHAAARRQTATEGETSEASQAVFLAFARRVRSLSRKTVLADWLFRATRFAARKIQRTSKTRSSSPLPGDPPPGAETTDGRWSKVAPLLD